MATVGTPTVTPSDIELNLSRVKIGKCVGAAVPT